MTGALRFARLTVPLVTTATFRHRLLYQNPGWSDILSAYFCFPAWKLAVKTSVVVLTSANEVIFSFYLFDC